MPETTPKKFTDFGLQAPAVWGETVAVYRSQQRILEADSSSDADRQIALEQLGVLHAIRRILLWVLVIIPAVAAGLLIVSAGISASSDSGSTRCTSIYSC